MKINSISNIRNTNFLQKNIDRNAQGSENSSSKNIAIAAGCAGAAAAGAVIFFKCRNKSVEQKLIREMTPKDRAYRESILMQLRQAGIKCEIKSLSSIVAPDEFKELVKKFKPEHFQAGKQLSEQASAGMSLEEFYKNAVDGNFRVSLHTHTNCSDGKATPEVFLECARKYADKVASMNKNDGLPPFTIALTDHDTTQGCAEIIKLIAQNPKKYKNLKFVVGCEFSVRSGETHHDITGLALNPFDKGLKTYLEDLSQRRYNVVKNFLDSQPEYNGHKINFQDLMKAEKEEYVSQGKGTKQSIENGSGIVAVRHAIKYFYKYTNQPVNREMVNKLGDMEISSIEQVLKTIKDNGGHSSLTHPLKSFWRYIGDEALIRLKDMGVEGIEVNHQYTPSKITKLGEITGNKENSDKVFQEITEKYRNFAQNNGMFISGGTDSHELQIFSRQPSIDNDFLETRLLK